MKNIVIVGAGDLGKELTWLIEDINRIKPTYLILGFLDDNYENIEKEYCGYKVLGKVDLLDSKYNKPDVCAVVAIKDPKVRRAIVKKHITFKNWETIIHPSAVIAPNSRIGQGSIVFPNVTVSVDTVIGDFALLYIQSVVLNDCIIGECVSVMANVTVQDYKKIDDGTVVRK